MGLLIGRVAFMLGFVILLLTSACTGDAGVTSEAVATQVATPTLEVPTQVVTLEEMLTQTPTTPTVAPAVVATPEIAATSTTVDILDEPLLRHPDTLGVEFHESVTEQDQRLVTMALEVARPLFKNAGFPLTAKIYVAGSKESYLQFADFLDMSPEKALKKYETTRGSTDLRDGRILINIPRHDASYNGAQRDKTLVFTVVHESYHVLQAKLSEGQVAVTTVPLEFHESSANLGAWRAILAYFCKPPLELNTAVSLFEQAPECSEGFVEENVLDYEVDTFFRERTAFSAVELYLISKFGVDAYDLFYAELAKVADTGTPGEEAWLQALDTAFGASSPNDLFNQALAYIEEHTEELIQRWKDLNARP